MLVIPDMARRSLDDGREPGSAPDELTGGLAPEGAIAIESFVREGGKLVAWADSCSWVVEQFGLPVVEVTGEASAKGFLCPGSVLRGVVEPGRITAGLPHDVSVFFDNSKAWREMTKAEMEKVQVTSKALRTLCGMRESIVVVGEGRSAGGD